MNSYFLLSGGRSAMAGDDTETAYSVGRGKAPMHTRFQKGASGNPKGRPKGSRNFRTEFFEELNEEVPLTLGGKLQNVSKQRIAIKALVGQAMKGNVGAAAKMFEILHKLNPLEDPSSEEGELSID